MKPIDPDTLRAGQVFPLPLFSRRGTKLLGAGIELSSVAARRLRRLPGGSIYMARTLGELSAAGLIRRRNTDPSIELKPPLSQDAATDARTIAGRSDFEPIALDDVARRRAPVVRAAEEIVWRRERVWSLLPSRIGDPAGARLGRERADDAAGVGWPDPEALAEWRGLRIERVGVLLERIASLEPVGANECESIVGGLFELQRRYPERFAQLAMHGRAREDHLAEHAYTVSALCVAIAAHLGWGESAVTLAGVAGLVADVGMLLVPERIRRSSRGLDDAELNATRRHVWTGPALLARVEGLSELVVRAAHRHHERMDGSGYPRGIRGERIDDLSRVVAVADSYAAATHPRAHKPPKRPYDGMSEVIGLGSGGVLDRGAVRALVRAAGLFPVGSGVVLSSGESGVVVCTDAARVDRPLVRVRRESGDRLVDLRDETAVRVVRAGGSALAA